MLGENAYIAHAADTNEALIIDPGYGTAERIKDYLKQNQLTAVNVLLTHGHPDHVWDCAAFNAPVWIPGPDSYRLQNPMAHLPFPLELGGQSWNRPADIRELPTQTITLAAGIPVLMVPAPGHSEGSAIFLTEVSADEELQLDVPGLPPVHPAQGQAQPLAWCGDVIFAGSVGRTDLPGGDETQMRHTLRTLANAIDPATWLLPGHGPATTWDIEKRTNPYVIRARELG